MSNAVVRYFRAACLAAVGLCGSAMAADYYVAPWGDDSNDGLSWETAMKSPEVVVVDRWNNTPNHTLTISNGTYKLTKRMACTVNGDGSFEIRSLTGKPEDVILDGQGQCGGIYLYAGYNSVIEGLTVTNCVVTDSNGSGIFLRDTRGQIKNCIVSDCHVKLKDRGCEGGGISTLWCTISGTRVENCSIESAEGAPAKGGQGGGIWAAYQSIVTNCVVRGCAIRQNAGECYPYGGGVYLSDNSAYTQSLPLPAIYDTEISACEIAIPYAYGGAGAGLFITCAAPDGAAGEQRQAIVRNCLIASCTNWFNGPLTAGSQVDVINTTVTNCVNSYPYAISTRSSGIYMSGKRVRVLGCLIAGNSGVTGDTWNGGTPAVKLYEDCSLVDSAIVGNSAGSRVALWLDSNILVSNCLFRANVQTAAASAGLVYVGDLAEGAKAEVVDSYFIDNDTSKCNWGGWVWFNNSTGDRSYEVRFRNCLYANNKTGGGAALIYSYNGAKRASKLDAVFENCTLANNENNGSYQLMHGYYETRDAAGLAEHDSPFRMKVRGCVIAGTTGTAGKGIEQQIYVVTNNVNYSVFPFINSLNLPHPDSVGDKEYDAGKPLFVDAEAKDYRQAEGSQALDMVPASPWMGTGRKNGPQDLGSGCEVVAVEDHGVTISRLNASRRLSGDCADAGCTELYRPLGMSVIVR